MDKKVTVPDMSCAHCEARINKALQEAKVEAVVDLATKTVSYNGDDVVVKAAIEDAGYTVEA